jgi:hypothetical protein
MAGRQIFLFGTTSRAGICSQTCANRHRYEQGRTFAKLSAIRAVMKFAAERSWSDPEKAARKLLEIANDVEVVQDGRFYIELINRE